MKPNTDIAKCCATCRHCFVKQDYDGGPEYFCNIDNDRPERCGSLSMGEDWGRGKGGRYDKELWDSEYTRWTEWEKDHEVRSYYICEDHDMGELDSEY